jgi:hypothetical protein
MNWLAPKLVFPPILVVNWVSSYLLFVLSTSTAATYIFTAPTCRITIVTFKPCALNAYYDLIKFHYYVDTTERGDRGWKQAQRQGHFTDNSILSKKKALKINKLMILIRS